MEQEWEWTERYATQPEILQYAQHVASAFDLRRDIRFESRVAKATFASDESSWEIETEDGRRARARYLITAVGPLSAPTLPNFEGMNGFEGQSFHTARWPHERVDFEGS